MNDSGLKWGLIIGSVCALVSIIALGIRVTTLEVRVQQIEKAAAP